MNDRTNDRPSADSSARALDAHFERMLPALHAHAEVAFRGIRCRDTRDDRTADLIALCWRWYRVLMESGRAHDVHPSALATYAARAVWSGRRVQGQARSNGVMFDGKRHADAPRVEQLADEVDEQHETYLEALCDNTVSPVPEQVAFRLDFPAFLGKLSSRNAAMALRLMEGHRTGDVAQEFGVSAARVAQLRGQLFAQWNAM